MLSYGWQEVELYSTWTRSRFTYKYALPETDMETHKRPHEHSPFKGGLHAFPC